MSAVERVYACQPQYGNGCALSHRQFWIATGRKYSVTQCGDGGSLLANVFNSHWVNALNRQAKGEKITHFAMLHDDVVPEDAWVDKLVDELLLQQRMDSTVDLLSVVVPIKDGYGVTSTAIDGESPFEVTRRLTMTEVHNLPETFSNIDCGYPERALLVNTGCWICDFTKPWRFDVHFEIRDRILRLEDGTFTAQVAPEDWNFSRDLHNLGVGVRATTKIGVSHFGSLPYINAEPWGMHDQDFNLRHRHNGQIVGDPNKQRTPPVNVEGWLTDNEAKCLVRHAEGKEVLEIGSYKGKSTINMARVAKKVVAVDVFDHFPEFSANLTKFKVGGIVIPVPGRSETVVPQLTSEFDMVFIDADHSYTAVERDTNNAIKKLRSGGIIAYHDYDSPQDPDVAAYVNNQLGVLFDRIDGADKLIVVKVR